MSGKLSRVRGKIRGSKNYTLCKVRSCFNKAFCLDYCQEHYAKLSRERGKRECQKCGVVYESVYDGDKINCRSSAGGLHNYKKVI